MRARDRGRSQDSKNIKGNRWCILWKKGLFSWFSIFQIRVSFNFFEIELSVFREITVELQFFPQEMEVMFSENRGHSVYCGVDKPLITSLSCLSVWHGIWILTCIRNCSVGLIAPWERQPYWLLAPKTNMSKPSLFVFLPVLLLQEAHAQIRGPCYSSRFLTSCSMSQQSQPAGLRVCISLTLFTMPRLLSSAMVRAER